ITPFSVEDDTPIRILNGKVYPKNESRTYSGRITINEAVMQSINTVSMKTLEKLTIERSYNFLTANLGITSLSKKGDKNLAPLSLGQLTNGITILEMAAAYAPFANGGTYYEPRTYTKVLDNNGDILLEKKVSPVTAMSKKTATYMSYMLQNVVKSGTGTYAQLKNGVPAAAKTGTSNNDEDRWFVGYTPYYVGAVWFGYDQPKYISKSLSPALTTWENVMNAVHKDLPSKSFEKNDEFKLINVCSCSGLLATENCKIDPRGSKVVAGYFHKDDVPKKACNVHITAEIDKTTNMLASEFCPAENKGTVALLDITRSFVAADVTVGDEQYILYNAENLEKAHYLPDVENPMNSVCTAHTFSHSGETPNESEITDSDDVTTTDTNDALNDKSDAAVDNIDPETQETETTENEPNEGIISEQTITE
ncbi:MAG: hypothetical protein IKU45_06460, partial [Clostridia bacterium]|nr:hypothetical protein [Clostridia bacterium]